MTDVPFSLPVFFDEQCPVDQAFVLNPAWIHFEPDLRVSGMSTPITEDTLTAAWRAAETLHPQVLVVHPSMARRLRARLERWVELPADVDGNMRCPTCFRRLRHHAAKYAYRCPARSCPLNYEITDRQLAARRRDKAPASV